MMNPDEEIDVGEEIETEEEEINTPFDPSQIRVDARPMTIDLVLDRIRYEEIDLAPDFQRHADIWNDTAKSRLIESILIRIPLPAFYIDATNEDKWLVIDGLQRLSAIKKFAIDNKLRLQKLEFLTQLEGKNYEEIPRSYQRRIKETILTIYSIEKGTPPEVKYNIFRRINTGGEPLSPQELRHALNPGLATNFLKNLAEKPEFKRVVKLGGDRQKRMNDREFILGFIAFYLTPYSEYPDAKGRDSFLNDAMVKINHMCLDRSNNIENKFTQAMKVAWNIFDDNAFRKISLNGSRKQPINQSLFEAWSVLLSKLNSEQQAILVCHKEKIMQKFAERIDNDPEFVKAISQASQKIFKRFTTIQEIIEEVIND